MMPMLRRHSCWELELLQSWNSSCCQSWREEGVNDENNYDFPLTFKSRRKNEDKQGKVQRGFLLHCIFAFKVVVVPKSSSINGLNKSNLKYSIAVSDHCFTVILVPKSQDLNMNRKKHLNSTTLSAMRCAKLFPWSSHQLIMTSHFLQSWFACFISPILHPILDSL